MARLLLAILIIMLFACRHVTKPSCETIPAHNDYCDAEKYGYYPYYNIDIAKQCAKATGRQILLMFTGYNCLAIHGAEWEVLADKEVKQIIDDNYILTVLYGDDKTPLDTIDTTQQTLTGVVIKTVGQKNSALEANLFQSNIQPLYICVDSDLNKIGEQFSKILLKDKDQFMEQLIQGLRK